MSESKWISVTERLPVNTARYLAVVNGDVLEVVFYMSSFTWRACAADLDVHPTYWMPLPNPPPRQSSFEKWWASLLPTCGSRHRRVPDGSWFSPEDARLVWNAAEKAVLSKDYVP